MLPTDVVADKAKTDFEDGILTISLPKVVSVITLVALVVLVFYALGESRLKHVYHISKETVSIIGQVITPNLTTGKFGIGSQLTDEDLPLVF